MRSGWKSKTPSDVARQSPRTSPHAWAGPGVRPHPSCPSSLTVLSHICSYLSYHGGSPNPPKDVQTAWEWRCHLSPRGPQLMLPCPWVRTSGKVLRFPSCGSGVPAPWPGIPRVKRRLGFHAVAVGRSEEAPQEGWGHVLPTLVAQP